MIARKSSAKSSAKVRKRLSDESRLRLRPRGVRGASPVRRYVDRLRGKEQPMRSRPRHRPCPEPASRLSTALAPARRPRTASSYSCTPASPHGIRPDERVRPRRRDLQRPRPHPLERLARRTPPPGTRHGTGRRPGRLDRSRRAPLVGARPARRRHERVEGRRPGPARRPRAAVARLGLGRGHRRRLRRKGWAQSRAPQGDRPRHLVDDLLLLLLLVVGPPLLHQRRHAAFR